MEQNFIIAGFGGQGVLFAGKVLANAFMLLGKNVTWYPCYGAEMRGGTVNCEIVISDEEVSSVHKENADYIIDMGPEGGKAGGEIIFSGTVANLKKCSASKTAKFV